MRYIFGFELDVLNLLHWKFLILHEDRAMSNPSSIPQFEEMQNQAIHRMLAVTVSRKLSIICKVSEKRMIHEIHSLRSSLTPRVQAAATPPVQG